MIYKIKRDKNIHYLEPNENFFNIVGKDYGNTNKYVDIFYNNYVKSISSTGVMLTGSPGSGKTRIAEKLANKCIENGMFAVLVTDIRTSIETVDYISMLRNCVIIFDEFGKNFDRRLQQKMLTMLSSAERGKKLFIITENETGMISEFILNRPGRIKYHLTFDKMELSMLEEYCLDYNVDKEFFKDLRKLYDKAAVFTYDHMQAIVDEHLDYPTETLEDIVNRLNLIMLRKKQYLVVNEVLYIKDDLNIGCKYKVNNTLLLNDFMGGNYWMNVVVYKPDLSKDKEDSDTKQTVGQFKQPVGESDYIDLNKKHITEYVNDRVVCEHNDYKIIMGIEYK